MFAYADAAYATGYLFGTFIFVLLVTSVIRWLAIRRSKPFIRTMFDSVTLSIAVGIAVLVAVGHTAQH